MPIKVSELRESVKEEIRHCVCRNLPKDGCYADDTLDEFTTAILSKFEEMVKEKKQVHPRVDG
jgi:hypothetical protein